MLVAVRLRAGARFEPPSGLEDVLEGADLGVWLLERLHERKILANGNVSRGGRTFFEQFGIDLDGLAKSRRAFSRTCLDWSERRHHLGGALGAAILDRIFALRWARRELDGRAVIFSANGERAFRALVSS